MQYKFELLGKHVWTVHYLRKHEFVKRFGAETYGITECDDKAIYLTPSRLKMETVVHELIHAYLWELCAKTADLEDDQLEEVMAEMFSKYGKQILRRADLIIEAYGVMLGRVSK